MPGIDRTRVEGKDQDELDEFICSICRFIFEEPVVTHCCRQSFCRKCIEWEVKHNCPKNRNAKVGQISPAPLMVINLLNKLKIKCENYGKGCQTVLTIKEMANHIKTCNTCDSCKTSKKLLSDKQNEIQSLELSIENMRIDLNQFKGPNPIFKEMEVILFQILFSYF